MSLESFFGLEDSESTGSAEASEKFREQMRKNAKAIVAMTGHQKAQKQKEDKLAALFVRYLQDQSKSDLLFLVVKLLQENVPGAFILAVLSISDAELEEDLRKHLKDSLPEGGQPEALSVQVPDQISLPPEVKNDLNAWGDTILQAGLMRPGKTLSTVLTEAQKLKSIVLDLIDYSLEMYLHRKGISLSESQSRQFGLLSIQSVLIKLRDVSREKTDEEVIETPLESEAQEA